MKTLGSLLQERRSQLGISISEAASQTHIREKYLNYLESGDYEKFPAALQIKGFIRIYADYLGIAPDDAMAFYRRESAYAEVQVPVRFYYPAVKKITFKITSQFFVVIGVFSMLGLAVLYVLWQYFRFAGAPQLELFAPRDGLVVDKSPIVVEGKISADARLTLNNTSLRVGEDGYFSQEIPLASGVNTLTFTAVNSSGKATTVKRVVRLDE